MRDARGSFQLPDLKLANRWSLFLVAAGLGISSGLDSLGAPKSPSKPAGVKTKAAGSPSKVKSSVRKPLPSSVEAHDVPVGFMNGEVSLSGTLSMPKGAPPFPAVVLIPDIGPVTREVLARVRTLLVNAGVAVLAYDQRGAGTSGGNWIQTSVHDLAGDAGAAMRWLKASKEIRADAVGVWGAGQGGWAAALAGADVKETAFVVFVSTPSVSPAELDRQRVKAELTADGFSAPQIQEGVEAWVRFRDELRRSTLTPEQEGIIFEANRSMWWFEYGLGALKDVPTIVTRFTEPGWDWSFEVRPILGRLTCPVLVLAGEKDCQVPVKDNLPAFEKSLSLSPSITVKVFEGASHLLAPCLSGSLKEMGPGGAALSFSAPGAEAFLAEWVARRVLPVPTVPRRPPTKK